MKLWDVACSKSAIITGYDPDLDITVQNRLFDLGFAVGARVECVRSSRFSGPRIFSVHQTLYALEKSIAVNIQVRSTPETV